MWLFSWRETLLVNIQGKNANARRRFWWRHVIGNSSHWTTPTIVWHNIEDLKTIASTKTDGIICKWACCHNSREDFFCSFFIGWFCLFPEETGALFILKQTITKKELSLCGGPSSHHLLWFVYSMFWVVFFSFFGWGFGGTTVTLPWAKNGRVH